MSNQALTEILAAVANGEGAADTDTVQVSLGALRALVRQEPYAYEHGRTNGDGTFSVVIDKGDLVRVSDTVYKNGPPRNPVKDWPVKPLYAAPVVAGQETVEEAERLRSELIAYQKDVEGAERRTLAFAHACVRDIKGLTIGGALEAQRDEIARLRAELDEAKAQRVSDAVVRNAKAIAAEYLEARAVVDSSKYKHGTGRTWRYSDPEIVRLREAGAALALLAAAKNSCQQRPTVHASYECPHCGAVGSHEQDSCHLIAAAKKQGGV